uniref:Iq calmodulin-binding motif protein n=1 Tax=Colletotrichum fructicola (strain Nara gc5) TaxID=1213859 RepID=L2G8Q1_COLFN
MMTKFDPSNRRYPAVGPESEEEPASEQLQHEHQLNTQKDDESGPQRTPPLQHQQHQHVSCAAITPPASPPVPRSSAEDSISHHPDCNFSATAAQSDDTCSLAQSHTSTNLSSRQEYMDSLVPPSRDEFEKIAEVQREREEEIKLTHRTSKRRSMQSQQSHSPRHSEDAGAGVEAPLKSPTTRNRSDSEAMKNAAALIQRNYRGYRVRREMKGFGLDPTTRWMSAIEEMRFREMNRPRAKSSAALSVNGGDEHSVLSRDSDGVERRKRRDEAIEKRKKDSKMMGLQYFLEMVDLKHRYGSNLRVYHEEWKKSDTNENFFYWLDYGGGKNVEMEACPRDRLEREQVRYLSREERQYYLVQVDSEGRLTWAKNGERIDTTESYKDSVHGIVPADDPTPAWSQTNLPPPEGRDVDDSRSESSVESALEADRAAKYATPEFDGATGMKKVSHISATTVFNKLLRKSVKKNTWIFVADTSFRLLSPLSGHYRPPASNFRAFVKSLKEAGVDTSHVSISKSYAVLVGLEVYVKSHQKSKKALEKLSLKKEKIVAPEEFKKREEDEMDKSESAAKERKVLEKEAEEREENRAAVKLMRKLNLQPSEPRGQREGEPAMEPLAEERTREERAAGGV